ncbi:T9SS-dependent M36 family metallopeptidase [Psychroflexus salis]|uniref:Peptidase M36 n=1 Tax=Psychroflexus salis TaxID=1526574 RepID=A0A917EA29_9FLAO|nr:T9SS-dependent M36 family metallopeptidase [Psychroflexus salis]GGE18381.1 peptidase M36 [Psychroflexus salis]
MSFKKLVVFCIIYSFSFPLFAQDFTNLIQQKLNEEVANNKFSQQDVTDVEVNSSHYAKSTKTNNVYIIQQFSGIPIFNALGVLAIRDEKVLHFSNNFESNIANRINTSSTTINPTEAIVNASQQLGLDSPINLQVVDAKSATEFLYNKANISYDQIPVKLVYQKIKGANEIRLAWDLSIHAKNQNNWWSVRVDAQTGEIISKNNWNLSCNLNHKHSNQNLGLSSSIAPQNESLFSTLQNYTIATDGAQYNVYPIPVESPNHGERSLIIDPADANASPFGWHDTNGVVGAEFTITRGNNVWAQEDRAGQNTIGHAPDGGNNLVFDYPLAFDAPPEVYEDAAITNLFYWNNILHDILHQYGFDEASGNFQATNYTGEGIGNDFVYADAQDGAGINNATFGTPPDGNNPSMTMYLWSPVGPINPPLTIVSPTNLADGINGLEANFGPRLSSDPITTDLVLVNDINEFTTDYLACGTITNTAELNNKIAVVRRGECTFVSKVEKAQQAGALAVIVVNNVGGMPINMGGNSNLINIPSIMVSQADGEALITELESNTTINATLANNGPYFIDGDFDNGIIAHEYGHGVSNRLTGGSLQANCLFNEEQMGEGWSDFLGLLLTMKATDVATQGRGYGTFAISQPITGNGIRPTPYSTNTAISPFTFDITNNQNLSQPHGIGYIWAQMLWNMTWDLIDVYGFDPDLYNGNGGNNIALQLVIDGLKLQNCSPGFVDGRDAILMADELANNGANQCLIWQAFANRGLGWSADQGDADNRFDQVEAFDMPPTDELDCTNLSNQGFINEEFKLWPNPAKHQIHLDLGNRISGEVEISIFNINGKKLVNYRKDASNAIVLPINELNSGVYLIKVISNEATFTKKLLVN